MRKLAFVKGFTLIEMMVSITIFLIVTLSVMGLITTMFGSQRKVQQEQDFVVNLSESIFSLKNYLRPFTGFKMIDIKNPENFSDGDNCAAGGFSESIAMIDSSQPDAEGNGKIYYLTTQRISITGFNQETVRLILTTPEEIDANKFSVVMPLIKDFSVRSVCFKTVGVENEAQLDTVHPRVTVVIKARSNVLNAPEDKVKNYAFQFTVESRNITNIQNRYNSNWGGELVP